MTSCESTGAVGRSVLTHNDDAAVYAPQEDSQLLIEVCENSGAPDGVDVADLCTGSGVIALACARLGARSVTAIDSCAAAARAAALAGRAAGYPMTVLHSDIDGLPGDLNVDLVTCNPPYVPTPPPGTPGFAESDGPRHAWAAGVDGRAVLDPVCAAAPGLLRPGGTLLLVQSEFADIPATLRALRDAGLSAEIAADRWIPFGPVMTARTAWLERTGRLEPGRRLERIAVIRADKPPVRR